MNEANKAIERAKRSLGTNPFTKEYVAEAYKYYSEPFTKQFEQQRQALDKEAVAKGMYRGGGYTKALGESFESYQKKLAQDVMVPLTETAMKMGEQARQFDVTQLGMFQDDTTTAPLSTLAGTRQEQELELATKRQESEISLGERRQTLTERESAAGATGVWGGGRNVNLNDLGFEGIFDADGKLISGDEFERQIGDDLQPLRNRFLEVVGREATDDELSVLTQGKTLTPGTTRTLAGQRMETELEIAKAELKIAQDRLGISREELGLERTRLEKDSFTRLMEITGTSGSGSVSAADIGVSVDGMWKSLDDMFAAMDAGMSEEELNRKVSEFNATKNALTEAFNLIGHDLTTTEINSLMNGHSIDVTAAPTMEGRKFMIDSALAYRESLVQEGFSEREIQIVEAQNEREKEAAKFDRAIARARETGRLVVDVDGVSVDVETLEQRRLYMQEEMQDGQLAFERAKEANRQREEFARLTGQFEEFSDPVGVEDFLSPEAMSDIFPAGMGMPAWNNFSQYEDVFNDEFYATYGRIPTEIEIDVLMRGQKLDAPDPIETLARMAFDLEATGVTYIDHPEKGLVQVDSIAKRESDARITQLSNDHQLSIDQLNQAKLEFEAIQRGKLRVTVYDDEVGGPVTKYYDTLSKKQQDLAKEEMDAAIARAKDNITIAQDQLDLDRDRLEQGQLEFKVEAIGQYETEVTVSTPTDMYTEGDGLGSPVVTREVVTVDTIAKKNADQARTLASEQFEQAKAEFAAIQTGELDGDPTLAQEQMELARDEYEQAKAEFKATVTGKYNLESVDGVLVGVDTLSSQELAMRKGIALGYFGEGESAVNTLEAYNDLWNQQITERMTFLEEQRQRFTERATTADQLGYWTVGGPNGLVTAKDLGVNVQYASKLEMYDMLESAEFDMLAEAYKSITGKDLSGSDGIKLITGGSLDTGQEIRIETMAARAERTSNMWKQADLFGGLGDAKTAAAKQFAAQLTLDTDMSAAEIARINKAVEQADRQLDQAAMEFATTTTLNLVELMGRLGEGGSITADQLGVDVGPAQKWIASNENHPYKDRALIQQFGGPVRQAYEAAFGGSLTDPELLNLLNGNPVETANSPTLQARQLAGTISQQSLERAADLKKFSDAHELETTQVANQATKWEEDRNLEATRIANQYDMDQRSFLLAKQELDATLTGFTNFSGKVKPVDLGAPTSEWLKGEWDSLGDMEDDANGQAIIQRYFDSVDRVRPGLTSQQNRALLKTMLWNGQQMSVSKTPTLQAEQIAQNYGLDLQRFTEASDQFDRNFLNQQKLSWMQLTGTTEEDFNSDSATSMQYKAYKQSMDEYQKNETKRDHVWEGFLTDAVDMDPNDAIGRYKVPIAMRDAMRNEMSWIYDMEGLDLSYDSTTQQFENDQDGESFARLLRNWEQGSGLAGQFLDDSDKDRIRIALEGGQYRQWNDQKMQWDVIEREGLASASFQWWIQSKLQEAKIFYYKEFADGIQQGITAEFGVLQPKKVITNIIERAVRGIGDPTQVSLKDSAGPPVRMRSLENAYNDLEKSTDGMLAKDGDGWFYIRSDSPTKIHLGESPLFRDPDSEHYWAYGSDGTVADADAWLMGSTASTGAGLPDEEGNFGYMVYGMGTDGKSEEEMGRLYPVLEGHQMSVAQAAAGPSGWAVAGQVAGTVLSAATQIGAAAASAAPAAAAASDRKVKDNVSYVGTSPSGLKVYEFDYKFGLGPSGRYRGVMADEIPRSAVVPQLGWYDRVDYSKIDVDFERIG